MLHSFVLTNYNYGRYLGEAVASICVQNGRKEIVIVDDGSSDESVDVIKDVQASVESEFQHFTTILFSKNRGKQAALNAALALVRGEITVIVDADDRLLPNFLEILTGNLSAATEADADVGFAYSDCVLVDEFGDYLANGRSHAFDAAMIQDHSYIPESAPTWTSWLRKALPLDETVRVGTKHQRWRKLIELGAKGCYVAEPLFEYRMHSQNISGIGERVRREEAGEVERILSGYWPTATGK